VIKDTERLCTVKYWREKGSASRNARKEAEKRRVRHKIMIPDRLSSSKTWESQLRESVLSSGEI
jgi:hypothetical protein